MGSVKDLKIIKEPGVDHKGIGVFKYSDRYSVFDWGEMPDTISNKGMAIALLGAFFFEKLEKLGIKTHYKGLIENNLPRSLSELKKPSNLMMVDLFRVVKPEYSDGAYNYSHIKNLTGNFLIPLEIIYRNALPRGSSVYKRLQKGEVSLRDLGLKSIPLPGEVLKTTLVDFSTKLEITDRYLTPAAARETSNLSNSEMDSVYNLVLDINRLITRIYRKIDAVNLDGKIELAFNREREFTVVDVLGTLDECRFEFNGFHLSKEVARVYYRRTEWYHETERAKEINRQKWKTECRVQPEHMPAELLKLISFMYCEVTNQLTGRKWFKVPLSLSDTVDGINTYLLA